LRCGSCKPKTTYAEERSKKSAQQETTGSQRNFRSSSFTEQRAQGKKKKNGASAGVGRTFARGNCPYTIKPGEKNTKRKRREDRVRISTLTRTDLARNTGERRALKKKNNIKKKQMAFNSEGTRSCRPQKLTSSTANTVGGMYVNTTRNIAKGATKR